MTFLRNCWYMAGWSSDLAGSPLGRVLLNEPVALFRDGEGVAHAVQDRCPHRFVRLSRGRVVNGALECPYHGLRFDGAGHCSHNPQGDPPALAKVTSYPLVERHAILWIWMGDAEKADPALIPDFSPNDPDENHVQGDHIYMDCDYRFCVDNILDLSHIQYTHRESLAPIFAGAAGEDCQTRQDGDVVYSFRRYLDVPVKPVMVRPGGPQLGEKLDFWLNVRWQAPAVMLLYNGAPDSDLSFTLSADSTRHTHIFTPETETRCHYWFGAARPKALFDADSVQIEMARLRGPFMDEDKPMLAEQQQAFGDQDFWAARPVILPADASAVRARRLLDKLIRMENAA